MINLNVHWKGTILKGKQLSEPNKINFQDICGSAGFRRGTASPKQPSINKDVSFIENLIFQLYRQ